ncbi:MAG: YdcF family protein [Hyphomonadaceae bacterium]
MSGVRAVLMLGLVLGVITFIAGFWDFASDVRASTEDVSPPPQSQAIVALTGGSIERLSTGVTLLEEQRAQRLLISGVNRIVTDEELFEVLNVDPALAECCVDLGRAAEDTLGNAAETAEWARANHFRSIILVTDDYHMPRSFTELSIAMPEAEIHRYPVRTRWTDPALWRSDVGAASRLGAEYVKYLMIRGREALIDLAGGKAETAEETPPS